MLEWLTANLGTILITAGLIVIVALIIRSIVRDKKAGISSAAQNAAAAEPAPWQENATAHRAAAAAPSGMLKT